MIYRVHRAKTFWRCQQCFKPITIGERYTVAISPPEQGKKGWRRRKLCRRCKQVPHEQ